MTSKCMVLTLCTYSYRSLLDVFNTINTFLVYHIFSHLPCMVFTLYPKYRSTGLPQAWGSEPAGSYSTGGIVPSIAGNVYFHEGLFSDTLSPFLKDLGDEAYVAYANIDCDLYTSTLDILEALHGRIVEGTILVFDEYICHPTWRQDEFRAWRESCKRFGWKYEYLGFSLSSKQAVVRVTGV